MLGGSRQGVVPVTCCRPAILLHDCRLHVELHGLWDGFSRPGVAGGKRAALEGTKPGQTRLHAIIEGVAFGTFAGCLQPSARHQVDAAHHI